MSEVDIEKIKEYLEENLELRVNKSSDYYGSCEIKFELILDNKILSSDWLYL